MKRRTFFSNSVYFFPFPHFVFHTSNRLYRDRHRKYQGQNAIVRASSELRASKTDPVTYSLKIFTTTIQRPIGSTAANLRAPENGWTSSIPFNTSSGEWFSDWGAGKIYVP